MHHRLLGAVILQKHGDCWQPVAYVSTSVTDADKRYAQTQRVVERILFAWECFHQCIHGQIREGGNSAVWQASEWLHVKNSKIKLQNNGFDYHLSTR